MRGVRIGLGIVFVVALVVAGIAFAPAISGKSRDQNHVTWVGGDGQVVTLGQGGRLGVSIRDLSREELARQASGAVVDDVSADSAAEKAGIKPGDIIVEYDGERVRSAAQLSRLVRETPAGRDVKVAVMRDGKRTEMSVAPSEQAGNFYSYSMPEGRSFNFDRAIPEALERSLREYREQPRGQFRFELPELEGNLRLFARGGRLGVGLQELTPQLGEYFGAADGVLISSVEEGSVAEKAGLKAGDVVTTVDGKKVTNGSELTRALRSGEQGREISLGIVRDKKTMTVKVKLEAPEGVTPRARIRA